MRDDAHCERAGWQRLTYLDEEGNALAVLLDPQNRALDFQRLPRCQAPPDLVGRGVYRAAFLTLSGHAIFTAVRSDHRRLQRAIAYTREEEQGVSDMLERLLDRVDPVSARRRGLRRAG